MGFELSVIIPTHNPRREYLARTLEALMGQTLTPEKWELVVVDNKSEDIGYRVSDIVHSGLGLGLGGTEDGGRKTEVGGRKPFLNARVVREERLGLTHARVRGFEEAKGEIVVMVDDDNVLRPDYLEKAVEILDKNPLLGAIGGKALPEYEIEPPEWLKGIRSGLGLRDLGSSEIVYPGVKEQGQVEGGRWKVEGNQRSEVGGQRSEDREKKSESGNGPHTPDPGPSEPGLRHGEDVRLRGGIQKAEIGKGRMKRKMTEFPECAPIGAGMVIRREAAMEYVDDLKNRSRVVTDRKGKSLSSGGDNDICLTVLEHGWQVGYFPELELTHLIPKERMTVDYQCRMARDAMTSYVFMLDQHGIRPWPAMARLTLPLKVMRSWWRTKPWKGPEQSIKFWGQVGIYRGRIFLNTKKIPFKNAK